MAYKWVFYSISACCTVGFFLNLFLIYVAYRFSCRMGAFKWLLIYFAFIEAVYAVVAFTTVPMFYGYDYRLVIFSHSTFMEGSPLAAYGAGLFCSFYEVWQGIVVILFVYKYVVLCRENIKEAIKNNWWTKPFMAILYCIYFTYCMICGVLFCTRNKIPDDMEDMIKEVFDKNNSAKVGYMVMTFKVINNLQNYENGWSWAGFMSVFNHLSIVICSGCIIVFSGSRMWKRITEMGEAMGMSSSRNEYKRNLQIFYTLCLQAAVPLFLYQIPTLCVLIDSLIEPRPFFTPIIPIFSLLLVIPKVLDPLIILFIIKEYRMAIKRMFIEGRFAKFSFNASSRKNTLNTVHPASSMSVTNARNSFSHI